jgi:methionyl-tRNA formyltransferase
MEKMNIAFLGGRVLGYKCLEILAEYTKTVNVEFIIAHKKDGETNSDWNPSILPLAIDLGFKVLEPPSLKTDSVFELFNDRNINLILNAFCNRIIPKKILDIAKYGAINFHYGKLPKYKGRFIVTHIILNGEKETCATAHFMTEDIDAGDIILTK